ncbi:MAG: tetratricopeptide repeat protein [Candidatus Accumulibacter sp.]|jgi:predicted O-linked N-acetylglucosamine transferase (SPINDLY family)|nr:tetratricopeptide repeat protein [Accumulibacter sp.]
MNTHKKNEAARLFAEGLAHQQAGRLAEARACYERGLKYDPGNPDALFLLGKAMFDDGDAPAGERRMRAAISARPQAANYHAGLALSLFGADRADEALEAFVHAVRGLPNDPALWRGLAVSAVRRGQPDTALDAVMEWRRLAPDDADAARLRDKLLAQRHFERGAALAEDEPEAAVGEYEAALEFEPESSSILVNLGNLHARLGHEDEARASYERAIAFSPDDASARFNLAMLYLDANRRLDAMAALERAAACDPGNGLIAAHFLFQKMHLCRWDGIGELARRVRAAVENDTADIPPFILLSMPGTTPDLQRRGAENHSRRLSRGETPAPPARGERRGRLRVGYLSSDFKQHATVFLMADMLEAHDRSRFEIFLLSYGVDDGSPARARVMAGVEHFVELAGLSARNAVARVAALELDVLIDLKGYTEGNHSEWLQYRLAPVQINWLGYPGTLGAPWADYLIADEIVAPMAHQWMFSERLWHLPGCYQPNCRERARGPAPARAGEGLPEEAIVLCSFNQTYKITPEMFALWLDALRAVPEAVLWLWASNPWAEDELRRVAAESGVVSERLVFAEGRPQAEHLARLPLADLALDTFPCNGHTTTSDALWAGVPVVTLRGEVFAARVAASLLTAAGLDELIAATPEAYRERIVTLCRDAGFRARMRARTEALRASSDLFDSAAFARKLEALLVQKTVSEDRNLRRQMTDEFGRFAPSEDEKPSARGQRTEV